MQDSQTPTAPTLPINQLIIDDSFNVRASHLLAEVVDRYAETFFQLPPVSVFKIGETFYLVDGWHRVASAKQLNLTEVPYVQVGEGTYDEAKTLALLANLEHGLPLTLAQRREVVRRLHIVHSDWSGRELAKRLGLPNSTVNDWLNEAKDDTEPNRQTVKGVVTLATVSTYIRRFIATAIPVERWTIEQRRQAREALKPAVELYSKLGAE